MGGVFLNKKKHLLLSIKKRLDEPKERWAKEELPSKEDGPGVNECHECRELLCEEY